MLKSIQSYDYQHVGDFDFKALCDLLANESYDLAASEIKTLLKQVDLNTLPFVDDSYVRSIMVNNQHYWLGLLNWDKGAKTRIHGHPEQAFVYLVKGRLSCKNFAKETLSELGNSDLGEGEYRYSKGVKGRVDNYIHQINAKEKSVSLHFYSDDPTKGEVFDL
ncbi:hypothetical protein [Candidatus Thioglobus sp.]|uniref:hypothetical protein n=1 Tax=Candidatus Thioglobus sp. TaxID=2026721 RepID=UPI003D14CC9F